MIVAGLYVTSPAMIYVTGSKVLVRVCDRHRTRDVNFLVFGIIGSYGRGHRCCRQRYLKRHFVAVIDSVGSSGSIVFRIKASEEGTTTTTTNRTREADGQP